MKKIKINEEEAAKKPALSIPPEIAKQGREAMQNYIRQMNAKKAAAAANAAASAEAAKTWQIRPVAAKYDDTYIKIFITNFKDLINNQDQIRAFNAIMPTLFKMRMSSVQNTGKNKYGKEPHKFYMIYFPEDKKEKFMDKGIKAIEQYLNNAGVYNPTSVKTFGDKIEETLDDLLTPEEVEAMNLNVTDNWKTILEALKNPSVRDGLLFFQTTKRYKDMYGTLQLSPSNIFEVRSADPMASFVTTPSAWKNIFKRKIVGTPVPIGVTQLVDQPWPSYIQNMVAQEFGCADASEFWSKYGSEPTTTLSFKKKCAFKSRMPLQFTRVKFVDVRFTEPIDPNNDPFVKLPGLINNLDGTKNSAAIERMKELGAEELEDIQNTATDANETDGENGKDNLKRLKKLQIKLIQKASSEGLCIKSTSDIVTSLSQNIYDYALKMAEYQNVLKDDLKAMYASAVLLVIAQAAGIPNNAVVNRAQQIINGMSSETMSNYAQMVYGCCSEIAGLLPRYEVDGLNEGIGGDELYNLVLKVMKIPTRNEIKESFFDFYNRMNNNTEVED